MVWKIECLWFIKYMLNVPFVNSLVKLNETAIVSGGMDKTLRVWDLTNDTFMVLNGHAGSVCSVVKLNETAIVSGSSDNSLRVWYLTNNTSCHPV